LRRNAHGVLIAGVMSSLSNALLLFLHLLAAAFWVGGMATMHFAVRPAAVATLEPPLRLPLMAAALARFFAGVTAAIALLFASGLVLVWGMGSFGAAHWRVHAMFGLALVMTAIYAYLRVTVFGALRRAVADRAWPAAAARLNTIRRLVSLNLGLGVAVFAVATLGRAL